jgi:hypothetical protein
VIGKIFLQEYPRAAHLGPGDVAQSGSPAEFLRVNPQECGCFPEIERPHG